MIKSNKLPKKQIQTLNTFVSALGVKNVGDTDTTSVTLSTVTSTHIFNK